MSFWKQWLDNITQPQKRVVSSGRTPTRESAPRWVEPQPTHNEKVRLNSAALIEEKEATFFVQAVGNNLPFPIVIVYTIPIDLRLHHLTVNVEQGDIVVLSLTARTPDTPPNSSGLSFYRVQLSENEEEHEHPYGKVGYFFPARTEIRLFGVGTATPPRDTIIHMNFSGDLVGVDNVDMTRP